MEINLNNINRNINYQKNLDKFLDNLNGPPKLLLHSCCGPCSSYCLEYLSNFFKITVFYYNPNIYPSEEYDDRIREQKKIIDNINGKYKIELIVGDYDTRRFYSAIKGLEFENEGGMRCYKCYELRLNEAGIIASKFGFDYFTTSLTISPHKDAAILNYIGNKIAEKYNVKYLETDFKKKGGFKRSTEITNKLGIYRQDYCGCIFSKKEMIYNNTSSIRFGVFGNPIKHSLSPFIHNYLFRNLSLPYKYKAFNVENAEDIINIIKDNNLLGANITMPFKYEIIKYLDYVSEEALISNSVNTIVNDNGILRGYTTDGDGFINLIPENTRSISIYGSGAAARSIIVAIANKIETINFIVRNNSKNVAKLLEIIETLNIKVNITDKNLPADVIVNTTPVGMNDSKCIINNFNIYSPSTLFIDIVYKKTGTTKFIELAQKNGFKTIDGKMMLLEQALLSFNIWTDKLAVIDSEKKPIIIDRLKKIL